MAHCVETVYLQSFCCECCVNVTGAQLRSAFEHYNCCWGCHWPRWKYYHSGLRQRCKYMVCYFSLYLHSLFLTVWLNCYSVIWLLSRRC